MGLYLGELIIGRIFESEIWGKFSAGLIFGRLIIGLLRCFSIPVIVLVNTLLERVIYRHIPRFLSGSAVLEREIF